MSSMEEEASTGPSADLDPVDSEIASQRRIALQYTITEGRRNSKTSNVNAVFYADSYHPIQAGSIDGTDITPHDNGVYRALICASANLYDPTNDPKVTGDPYCTVFVGHLSHSTTEDSLKEVMSRYGKIKNVRLVRHIVTGASRNYAFVAYESEREMRHAYEAAHHSIIDGSQVIVDYSRQQLMPGWIPRRLGGGLGGHKESGQLRFGGRERPFRAPLRPVPHEELKRLGISLPPEGRYMSRYQVPPPPRRLNSDGWREKSEFNKHHELSYQSNDVLDHIPSSSKENKRSRKRSSSQQQGCENQESDHARKRSRHIEDKSHSDSDDSDFSHRRKHQHHHRHRHRERYAQDKDSHGHYKRKRERSS